MEKKLIAFTDEQMNDINDYSEANRINSFTEAVRSLIELGLKTSTAESGSTVVMLYDKVKEMEEEVKKLSWWSSDDNSSRLGNLEVAFGEFQKQLNILTATSKLFKGHLKDRAIHLKD